jgi:hypothetical protein
MTEHRPKDPMMQPCRKGCGALVHLENDGFHVCQPTSKTVSSEVHFACGHSVAHEENCPRCEIERLQSLLDTVSESRQRLLDKVLHGAAHETSAPTSNQDVCPSCQSRPGATCFNIAWHQSHTMTYQGWTVDQLALRVRRLEEIVSKLERPADETSCVHYHGFDQGDHCVHCGIPLSAVKTR